MSVLRFHRRRTWRRFFLLILIAGSGVLFGLVANAFTVQSIICREDLIERCSPEITAELERFIGQRILLLRLKDMEGKIKQFDPSVKSLHLTIEVRKKSLRASVVRRTPVARISSSLPLTHFLLVDDEGIAFEMRKDWVDSLPVITWDGFSTLSVGQRVPDQLGRAVTLIRQLPAIIEVLGAVSVRAGSFEVTTVEGTLVTFSLEQDPATQLTALQLVLNQSKIDGVIYHGVDLRYDHPIVTKY